MRIVLCVAIALVMVGCSKREEPAIPNVQLTEPEAPTPEAVKPQLPPLKPPQSLLDVDFLKLWNQAGPKRLTPAEQADRLIELLHYGVHPDEHLTAELVGTGTAGPLAIAVRYRVQSDVLKRVKLAADEPFRILTTGGLRGSITSSGQSGGTRTVVISVFDPPTEVRERFREFFHNGVIPAVSFTTGDGLFETLGAATPGWKYPYHTKDRKGTLTVALLLPDADSKAVDSLIAPGHLSRPLVVDRKANETLLVVIVEEKEIP